MKKDLKDTKKTCPALLALEERVKRLEEIVFGKQNPDLKTKKL